MKISTLFLILISLISAQSHAFIKRGSQPVSSIKTTIKPSNYEKYVKLELEALKKKDVQAFNNLIEQKEANPETYQSYLYETRDGQKINQAKQLARAAILKHAQQNWAQIKDSHLNTNNAQKWEDFEYYLRRNLDQVIYLPSGSGKNARNTYEFRLDNWAQIKVDKNLKTYAWTLDINSRLDANKLETGADKIVIQGEEENSPASRIARKSFRGNSPFKTGN